MGVCMHKSCTSLHVFTTGVGSGGSLWECYFLITLPQQMRGCVCVGRGVNVHYM